ncbi:MAG TPA: hypothetical protein DCQ26_14365 [Marinilabiliales bacterium]|nr:MAG: hypothetical protein A2W96_16315 [Bacteroidetes bacterium GWD2_40_43]OFX90287.1 MAG: hypothetical protein A2W97_17475 [Bacteroidetes bacterium GWE2_40_63]OFY22125.1 MAG: hypothetical protein A2W88_09090 [Bacteroidetes bacterium GWF2_40_13]OFZ27750.1 MAG: hypothetical protein A2437_02200 [Bacteroidetes bacterium RIFOXYC2_FULL_40_12]HAM99786.1 hypothetical protein [Marinilabiliales bacterium]
MCKKIHVFLFLSLLTIVSCNDSSEVFNIGEEFTNNDSKITYVDTITVQASTILIDSFTTSDYNKVFFGYNNDPILGKTLAESYVVFESANSLPDIDSRSTFDSLVIFMKQNGDYLGDTSIVKEFNVYRITEDIEYGDNASAFYNIDSFAREETPLATKRFIPRPLRNDSITIKLPDELGELWYNWIDTSANSPLDTNSQFLDYFKGVVFVPVTTDESWLTSFNGYNSSSSKLQIELRLYYSKHDVEENTYFSFTPRENYIFTHFSIDRSGTVSSVLDTEGLKIPSTLTDNKVFMQAGSGVGIKIEIPQVEYMYDFGSNITVLDAKLIMRPSKGTYSLSSLLPSKLSVLWTDKMNRNLGDFIDVDGETVITGTKMFDDLDDEPYYSFSILNFVLTKMATESTSYNTLMFYLPDESNATSFDKLIIDDQSASNNSFELQIYYYTY